MRRLYTAGLVAVVGISSFAVLAAGGSAQNGGRSLVLKEDARRGAFKIVDNAPRSKRGSISIGDELIVRVPLLDPRSGQRRGTLHAQCVASEGGRNIEKATLLCRGVFKLVDGTLTGEGAISETSPPEIFAVTGGTGAYNGARGTDTVTHSGGAELHTFNLLP